MTTIPKKPSKPTFTKSEHTRGRHQSSMIEKFSSTPPRKIQTMTKNVTIICFKIESSMHKNVMQQNFKLKHKHVALKKRGLKPRSGTSKDNVKIHTVDYSAPSLSLNVSNLGIDIHLISEINHRYSEPESSSYFVNVFGNSYPFSFNFCSG